MFVCTAQSTAPDANAAAGEVVAGLVRELSGRDPDVLYCFHSAALEADVLRRALVRRWPETPVHGATSHRGVLAVDGLCGGVGAGCVALALVDARGDYGTACVADRGVRRQRGDRRRSGGLGDVPVGGRRAVLWLGLRADRPQCGGDAPVRSRAAPARRHARSRGLCPVDGGPARRQGLGRQPAGAVGALAPRRRGRQHLWRRPASAVASGGVHRAWRARLPRRGLPRRPAHPDAGKRGLAGGARDDGGQRRAHRRWARSAPGQRGAPRLRRRLSQCRGRAQRRGRRGARAAAARRALRGALHLRGAGHGQSGSGSPRQPGRSRPMCSRSRSRRAWRQAPTATSPSPSCAGSSRTCSTAHWRGRWSRPSLCAEVR